VNLFGRSEKGELRHVRDQQYFVWRFKNPRSIYRFLFWEDMRMEGYLVLQTGHYEGKEKVRIVDWEATNPQVRSDLLQAALRWGHFSFLTIWSGTLSDEVKTLLQRTGFNLVDEARSVTRYRPTLLIRPVRDEMLNSDWVMANTQLLNMAHWDLRMIYSDSY